MTAWWQAAQVGGLVMAVTRSRFVRALGGGWAMFAVASGGGASSRHSKRWLMKAPRRIGSDLLSPDLARKPIWVRNPALCFGYSSTRAKPGPAGALTP